MMIKNSIAFVIILALFFSCEKDKDMPVYDLETNDSVVVNTKNERLENKLDSLGFLSFISNQKLQEVYDLVVWSKKRKNLEVKDSTISKQLTSYFYKNDTLILSKIRKELDSLQVYYVKVAHIKLLEKDSLESDTIGRINFSAQYFNKDKKYIDSKENSATYFLKKEAKKLKNEFTFYISEISEKDTIRAVVTQ